MTKTTSPSLLRIMDASEDKEQVLDELSSHIRLSAPYKVYDDDSMYTIREESDFTVQSIDNSRAGSAQRR